MNSMLVLASSPDGRGSDTPGLAPAGPGETRSTMATVTQKHHQLVIEGVRSVWARWGREAMDLLVLSDAYGLRQADDFMAPYHPRRQDSLAHGSAVPVTGLGIRAQATAWAGQHALVVYLLARPHLVLLELPLPVPEEVPQIVLSDEAGLAWLPAAANLIGFLADGGTAARRWHVKSGHVRGFLFRRLCGQIVQHGPSLTEWLCCEPREVDSLFYKRARWRPQLSLWSGGEG